MYDYDLSFFKIGLKELGIELTEVQLNQFISYYEFLIEKNKVMNLTGITEFQEVIEKHFLDSLALVKSVSIDDINSIIDIGTGAGFPGVPLKIAFPSIKVVLLDSLNKRIKFLDEVIEKLELKDIYTIHGRAEDFAQNREYRENFDCCVSRAVANLSTLSEYCIPFVKKEGYFISYKSGEIEDELSNSRKSLHLLGGKLRDVVKFDLPNSNNHRSLVVIKKIESTSKKYPWKAGLPAKDPL